MIRTLYIVRTTATVSVPATASYFAFIQQKACEKGSSRKEVDQRVRDFFKPREKRDLRIGQEVRLRW